MEWNQIGSEGATSLAEALVFNTSLVHVDLRNNGIGDDGALALVKMLEENDTLKTLDLRWNQVNRTKFDVAIECSRSLNLKMLSSAVLAIPGYYFQFLC